MQGSYCILHTGKVDARNFSLHSEDVSWFRLICVTPREAQIPFGEHYEFGVLIRIFVRYSVIILREKIIVRWQKWLQGGIRMRKSRSLRFSLHFPAYAGAIFERLFCDFFKTIIQQIFFKIFSRWNPKAMVFVKEEWTRANWEFREIRQQQQRIQLDCETQLGLEVGWSV